MRNIVERSNVKVDEGNEYHPRCFKYDLNDQVDSYDKGKQVQTHNLIQIILEKKKNQGETSASAEERTQESKNQEKS